jgi:hypothetical protein
VKAALDALVGDALRQRGSGGSAADAAGTGVGEAAVRRTAGASGADDRPGPVVADRRTIPQLQADALAELARHALGCAGTPGTLPTTTIVVRMSLDALRDGVGVAEIDGIDRPIAAATARRLAADAELIPAVLGSDSVPLDLGRGARLFSRSQRIALMERDGGCASCGANLTYAQAHHIDWWSTGDGGRGRVWFIPPPHLDPNQTPRLGGRARFNP